MTPRPRDDAGSLTVELVVLAPAVLALLALVIAGGRAAIASQAVAQAASQAARDASLQATPAAATTAARSRADSVLAGQGLGCDRRSVAVNAAALANPPGRPGQVNVTLTCTVTWSDLGLPGPGSRTLSSTGTAPVDTWTAHR
ncbi:MAG: TadE/TadG family type IV pilus assembly protein [Candidatus Nanopelagicales bacterium]